MARAGRACWPATRGAELSTSIARGRRTAAETRRGSTTRPPGAREAVDGGGSGAGRDGAGRMARPGGGRRRRRRGRDELDVRPGGAGPVDRRRRRRGRVERDDRRVDRKVEDETVRYI